MKINSEADIIQLVQDDPWMMDILENARSLQLPDWWVCAGFVRSKVWDMIHNFEKRTPLPDVDVIYFDNSNLHEDVENPTLHFICRCNLKVPGDRYGTRTLLRSIW